MKSLISVGHTASGNVGCGAVGYLNESNCTREIVPLIVSKLKSLGHEAIKLQIDNSDSHDYVKRANQANSIGGDYFVEIHLNHVTTQLFVYYFHHKLTIYHHFVSN